MWYLCLDESGDLGFDFITRKPSKFFTIAILAVQGQENNRALTDMALKRYLLRQVDDVPFQIYALTLDKRSAYQKLAQEKPRIYDYITGLVTEQIPLQEAKTRVQFIIDRSKRRVELREFNDYIVRQLQGRLDPKVPLNFWHQSSHETPGLQAADLFAWGIFRKYERKDTEWLDCYKGSIVFDKLFS